MAWLMTCPDSSSKTGVLNLDPSPLCGNLLRHPCGEDGLSKSCTQEHILEGQETPTFRPPARGAACRKVAVKEKEEEEEGKEEDKEEEEVERSRRQRKWGGGGRRRSFQC